MFTFKGISSDTVGVAVKTIKAPTLASPRFEEVSVPGRDGTYKFFLGNESVEAILDLTVVGEISTRQTKIKEIRDWLKGTGKLNIDHSDEIEMTVMDIQSAEFSNASEVIRVIFRSGSSAGSSVPGESGGGGSSQDLTEIRNLIAEIQQKNTQQDTALTQKRDKAVLIEETDLSESLRQKVNAPAVTPYDDSVLRSKIAAIETKNSQQDTDIAARRKTEDKIEYDDLSAALKQKVDVAGQGGYDDSALQQRLSAVEQRNNQQDTAIAGKVSREAGKGLSEANFTQAEKQKLAGITAAGGYNDEELRNRIGVVEQRNSQQDIALAQRREKSVKITEADLADAIVEKLGKGEKGDPGPQGPPGERGLRGYTGNRGKSAYEVWRDLEGNAGKSEQQFIESLRANLTQEQVQALTNAVQNDANVKKLKYEDGKLFIFDGSAWHEAKGGGGGHGWAGMIWTSKKGIIFENTKKINRTVVKDTYQGVEE